MNFREWQAGYSPTLADIKVSTLDLARAEQVVREVYDILSVSERKGFGVWRAVSIEPCNSDDATCNWHGDHAAYEEYLEGCGCTLCSGL